jgi:hypothetical protein
MLEAGELTAVFDEKGAAYDSHVTQTVSLRTR